MKLHFLLLTFVLIFLIQGCKKKSTCVSGSDFIPDIQIRIGENIYGIDSLFQSDSIVTYFPNFEIGGKDAKDVTAVKWTISNSDKEYTTNKIAVRFPANLTDQSFTITLQYSLSPTAYNCLSSPYMDTLQKTFYIVCGDSSTASSLGANYSKPTFLGKWKGYFEDDPLNTFTVTIVDFGPNPNPSNDIPFYNTRIYNMPQGCGGPVVFFPAEQYGCGGLMINPAFYAPGMDYTYRGFYVNHESDNYCCPRMKVTGYVSPSNNQQIKIFYENSDTKITKRFIGQKEY